MVNRNETTRKLYRSYRTIEHSLPYKDYTHYFRPLAIASENDSQPVHRWFHFKEGFSHRLLDFVLRLIPHTVDIDMLDPFCGVGTSIVSAQMSTFSSLFRSVVGIERNPFLHFVAQTKSKGMRYDVQRFRRLASRVLRWSDLHVEGLIPELSTLHDQRAFSRQMLYKIVAFRDAIRSRVRPCNERNLLLLALASTIEEVSGVRKDGRGLRFKERRTRARFQSCLEHRLSQIEQDVVSVQSVSRPNVPSIVHCGDGRFASSELEGKTFNLILYSPPYFNNIDYSEVYKLELWLLGFVNNQKEFRDLRRSTFKSHPSCKFTYRNSLSAITNGRFTELKSGLALLWEGEKSWRLRLLEGYCEDFFDTLKHQKSLLRNDGRVVIVVGNSVHGGEGEECLVATDLLICSLAEEAGFAIDGFYKCRELHRRRVGDEALRESIIVLKHGPN